MSTHLDIRPDTVVLSLCWTWLSFNNLPGAALWWELPRHFATRPVQPCHVHATRQLDQRAGGDLPRQVPPFRRWRGTDPVLCVECESEGIHENDGVGDIERRCWVREESDLSVYIHHVIPCIPCIPPLYTFTTIHTPMYAHYTCISQTIYTPNTPLTTPYHHSTFHAPCILRL